MPKERDTAMVGRFLIEEVTPSVADGLYAAKAVVGELVPISARSYREGHSAMGCNVVVRTPDGTVLPFTRMRPGKKGLDTWHTTIQPDSVGNWTFTVEAFSDPYLTWHSAIVKKIAAGQRSVELANDLVEGAEILDAAAKIVPLEERTVVRSAATRLLDHTLLLSQRVEPALELTELLWQHPVREMVTAGPLRSIWVDRERALFSSWYEFFPRSETDAGHGTFVTAARRLPAVAEMGFDVVYLPPIHPIGRLNRKGRNNSVTAEPGDVGSPWAIGAAEGGHDAIHPQLGTAADFRRFVAAAAEVGLEVALDLALQCAPDHPWVSQHPDWFTKKPDGEIAFAENPPKVYQDIYPLNFDNDPEGLRAEVLRVVLHWIGQGVRIFRVDNPHTKPLQLWHWLIWRVKQEHPDVLFLAEAFTRPAMMNGLARVGFTQSYTYFTWRTTATELREYCEELVESADHMRPNFWTNTPDILHETLQHGGPPMFKIRAVLAGMLSPSWGMYAGYELFEHVARPGAEEYLDNEKYELRHRDWESPSLAPFITQLNKIRRDNPALRRLRNLRFHEIDNDELLCFSKRESGNTVLVVCTMDPVNVHWGNAELDMPALGLDWDDRFTVRDELTGAVYDWGQHNAIRLDPHVQPAHIFTVLDDD